MQETKEICVWDEGRIIPVLFFNLPGATVQEARNYVDYVKARIKTPLDSLTVTLCDDGKVDVHYEGNGTKFERIRRITGKGISRLLSSRLKTTDY